MIAELLRQNGVDFLIQIPIDMFVADFYIRPDIIIEVDGPHHEDEEIRKKDQYKDKILRSYGFKVERISYFMTDELSLDLIRGEIPPKDVNELNCLNDIQTRIDIILAKREINGDSDAEKYMEDINPR